METCQLLRVRDAAKALAVSERSVWRLVGKGALSRFESAALFALRQMESFSLFR
jgi:hypothetical protein